jgi:L-lactate dehydrogenase complex protein LldG
LQLPQKSTSDNPSSRRYTIGISWAAFAIAETGAIVEFATDDSMRLVTSLPLVHISLLRASDVVATLKEAAAPIRDFYNENFLNATVSFISGPSRTADIEMRLILGVHGPAETHVIIVKSKTQFVCGQLSVACWKYRPRHSF